MARRRIFWHIGPDDLGTRFLAQALDDSREALAEQGVQVAGTPAAWDLVSAELRHRHRALGYRRAEVDGQYPALVRRLWPHRGTSVLSTPGLAGATPEEVALALDAVRGAELHLVLVVRDEASRADAARQATLETGVAPEQEETASILERWGRTVLPERVHLIEATEPEQIWARLTSLLGAEVDLPPGLVTGQLDAGRLAVLGDVVATLGERIDAAGRRTAVRDLLVGALLAAPDHSPTDAATDALADALLEVARLQQANAELTQENLRLDRKRRKHKRRLKQLGKDAAA
ncbi:hypothetical protein D9V37_17470 [Nocardioides mangrovicus]|uniref:Uncharacterized protein n=1 Tax=Nocardioides mangrovicus TaxID=2478913 RepID=A0A3L8NYQ4_9ACTN|nr:hypothetical protein [Nocardioides mangrovicus]RLV47901.1 hypothetical protein D9V37_17470 [Nocardioides mangrovicus]